MWCRFDENASGSVCYFSLSRLSFNNCLHYSFMFHSFYRKYVVHRLLSWALFMTSSIRFSTNERCLNDCRSTCMKNRKVEGEKNIYSFVLFLLVTTPKQSLENIAMLSRSTKNRDPCMEDTIYRETRCRGTKI